MWVEGAPGSYYLVFLVPGAGNLILYHAFYFLLVWRTSLQCHAVVRTYSGHHKVAIEVEAIDWLIGTEYKSERTSDRD